jgi:predicted RNA binding protein YcfA (HicA-like mRNA interferase family)
VPRKIRDYKADLLALGFNEQPRRGKGSHHVWKHPNLRDLIVIAFKDGEDVPPYLEQQLKRARQKLESL